MPVYEYGCDACGHTFEKLVFHEEGEVRCPGCGGEVRKLLSPFRSVVADEACSSLPRGEARELCTECRQEGGSCPFTS